MGVLVKHRANRNVFFLISKETKRCLMYDFCYTKVIFRFICNIKPRTHAHRAVHISCIKVVFYQVISSSSLIAGLVAFGFSVLSCLFITDEPLFSCLSLFSVSKLSSNSPVPLLGRAGRSLS